MDPIPSQNQPQQEANQAQEASLDLERQRQALLTQINALYGTINASISTSAGHLQGVVDQTSKAATNISSAGNQLQGVVGQTEKTREGLNKATAASAKFGAVLNSAAGMATRSFALLMGAIIGFSRLASPAAFSRFRYEVENLGAAIGTMLVPILNVMTEISRRLNVAITTMSGSAKGWVTSFGAASTVLSVLVFVISRLIVAMQILKTTIFGVKMSLGTVGLMFIAFDLVLTVIMKMIAATDNATGKVTGLGKATEVFGRIFGGVWTRLSHLLDAVAGALDAMVGAIAAAAVAGETGLRSVIESLNVLIDALVVATVAIEVFFNRLRTSSVGVGGWLEEIKERYDEIRNAAREAATTAARASSPTSDISAAFSRAQVAGLGGTGPAEETAHNTAAIVTELQGIRAALDNLSTAWEAGDTSGIVDATAGVINAIARGTVEFVGTILMFPGRLLGQVAAGLTRITGWLLGIPPEFTDAVVGGVGAIYDWGARTISNIASGLASLIPNTVAAIISGTITLFTEGVGAFWDGILSGAGKFFDAVLAVFSLPDASTVSSWAGGLWDSVTGGIGDFFSGIGDWFSGGSEEESAAASTPHTAENFHAGSSNWRFNDNPLHPMGATA